MDAWIEKDQHIRFSGAGADNQNGVTKLRTQTVIWMDHTMMIQYVMRSPQGFITDELWTMEIDHVVGMYNRMPRKDYGLSTYELWSRSSFLPSK